MNDLIKLLESMGATNVKAGVDGAEHVVFVSHGKVCVIYISTDSHLKTFQSKI